METRDAQPRRWLLTLAGAISHVSDSSRRLVGASEPAAAGLPNSGSGPQEEPDDTPVSDHEMSTRWHGIEELRDATAEGRHRLDRAH
jgi:hypothetical protein